MIFRTIETPPEAVVIESREVRELLRFLFYLDILKKHLLLQCKHSKYMYASCLNFPCFIKYLAAYMHAFCMFYLYVSLGLSMKNVCAEIRWKIEGIINFYLVFFGILQFLAKPQNYCFIFIRKTKIKEKICSTPFF